MGYSKSRVFLVNPQWLIMRSMHGMTLQKKRESHCHLKENIAQCEKWNTAQNCRIPHLLLLQLSQTNQNIHFSSATKNIHQLNRTCTKHQLLAGSRAEAGQHRSLAEVAKEHVLYRWTMLEGVRGVELVWQIRKHSQCHSVVYNSNFTMAYDTQ